MEMFNCECGTKTLRKHHTRHLRSQKHLKFLKTKQQQIEQNKIPIQNEKDAKASESAIEEEEHVQDEEVEEVEENTNQSPEPEADEQEQEEEVVVENKSNVKKQNYNKFHLDAIRQKAIATIKQKKQAKIDKENEIKYKAEQYDHLVKSLKQKEEDEKKKKEEEKIKEMEYKSSQYDKMVKNQQRTSAITSLSNEKIINDIKEQRLLYLMKYLQNPSHY